MKVKCKKCKSDVDLTIYEADSIVGSSAVDWNTGETKKAESPTKAGEGYYSCKNCKVQGLYSKKEIQDSQV